MIRYFFLIYYVGKADNLLILKENIIQVSYVFWSAAYNSQYIIIYKFSFGVTSIIGLDKIRCRA